LLDREQWAQQKTDLASHLSPLLRHHIGIYGQYNFDFRRFEAAAPVESLTY
jgi:hypothetical protein